MINEKNILFFFTIYLTKKKKTKKSLIFPPLILHIKNIYFHNFLISRSPIHLYLFINLSIPMLKKKKKLKCLYIFFYRLISKKYIHKK